MTRHLAAGVALFCAVAPAASAAGLRFGYDCVIATRPLICIGGHVRSGSAGTYEFQPGAVLPENVTPAAGKVIYRLYATNEGRSTSTVQWGVLIVQMVDNNRIKVEASDNPLLNDFTGAAFYYIG